MTSSRLNLLAAILTLLLTWLVLIVVEAVAQENHVYLGSSARGSSAYSGAQFGIVGGGSLRFSRVTITADTSLDRIRKINLGEKLDGWRGLFDVDVRVRVIQFGEVSLFTFPGLDAAKLTLFDGKDAVAFTFGGGVNYGDRVIVFYRKQLADNSQNAQSAHTVGFEFYRPIHESRWLIKVTGQASFTSYQVFHEGHFAGHNGGVSVGIARGF